MTLKDPAECSRRKAGWTSPIKLGPGHAMAIPCGECGAVHAGAAPAIVIDLCGEFLCFDEATTEVIVRELRGHVLKLCDGCAKRLADRAEAEGVADKIEFRRIGS